MYRESGGMKSIWSDEALSHAVAIVNNRLMQLVLAAGILVTCSWLSSIINHCRLIINVTDSIWACKYALVRTLNMLMCWMDNICLWITVSVFCIKCKVDSCPAKRQFDFWPSANLVVVHWLHLDRGQRSEYRIYWSVTPLNYGGGSAPYL